MLYCSAYPSGTTMTRCKNEHLPWQACYWAAGGTEHSTQMKESLHQTQLKEGMLMGCKAWRTCKQQPYTDRDGGASFAP